MRPRFFFLLPVVALATPVPAETIPIPPPPSGDYEQPSGADSNPFGPVTISGLSAPANTDPSRAPVPATGMVVPAKVASAPGVHNQIHTPRKVIALTFDDGPHRVLTPRLLDILREQNVHATFFVLGSCVAANPDIAKRIVVDGHEIANHSWNHPSLPTVSAVRLSKEIDDTTAIIEKTTGRKVTLLRPTYGAMNDRVKQEILGRGLQVILWSVDPRDWKRPGSAVVTRRLVDGAHPGAILLAHDIHPGTIEAVPDTIAQLKAKGYEFVTVSQLLAMDEPPPPKPSPTPKPSPSPKPPKATKPPAPAVESSR